MSDEPQVNPVDIRQVIDRVRARFGDEFVSGRTAGEDAARSLLDNRVGHMSAEEFVQLGSSFNRNVVQGKVRSNRFAPAFMGATINRLIEHLDLLNEWTRRIWGGTEEEALAAAGELITNTQALPGSGRSYPTMLLYLRDSERFAVWINATEQGLRILTDYPGRKRKDGLEGYLEFSRRCKELIDNYSLAPQEIDAILAHVVYQAKDKPTVGTGLHPDTFQFLADLRANNTGSWMSQNGGRYQTSLRGPFRQLLETVASNYIGQLDPALITDIKLGKVLASIRKRFPDPSGEYYDYYWGAFTRSRKQEDIQLFAIVRPEHLRFGLGLASAKPELRQALSAAIPAYGEQILAGLAPQLEGLRFSTDEEQNAFIEVETPDHLLQWAAAPKAALFREVDPSDALAFSGDLADVMGKTFEAVYPLAALGWGVLPEDSGRPGESDEIPESYTIDQLVEGTHVPEETLLDWVELLKGKKKQALFYGPPGSGKTHIAEALARFLAQPGEIVTVQFHPSYSYEDFIEGLRPITDGGEMPFEVRPGTFQLFCDRARRNLDATYVLVVDEINRADLGSTLGELMLLLEYRGKIVELPYSQRRFSIPSNVIVLGTMNTADRSLALVDFALRRRFHAIYVPPSREVLSGWLSVNGEDPDLTLRFFDLVQSKITSRDFAPGHSYWMSEDRSPQGLLRVWQYELRPYLQEFWFENPEQLRQLEDQVTELLTEGDEGDLAP